MIRSRQEITATMKLATCEICFDFEPNDGGLLFAPLSLADKLEQAAGKSDDSMTSKLSSEETPAR
jgi:hypothetical protein